MCLAFYSRKFQKPSDYALAFNLCHWRKVRGAALPGKWLFKTKCQGSRKGRRGLKETG